MIVKERPTRIVDHPTVSLPDGYRLGEDNNHRTFVLFGPGGPKEVEVVSPPIPLGYPPRHDLVMKGIREAIACDQAERKA